ncbi:MAG TPA: hypothetical protein VFZ16_20530 [Hyphomicrobiaceae bacterium]|nr:hypothetical protein [Hyphomicrobiaceae bacterium]
MLSTDRSESRADQARRNTPRMAPDAVRQAEAREMRDPWLDPWDDRSAEALTRLYESEEGRLSKPASGDRARRPRTASEGETDQATAPEDGIDHIWLEQHLSRLVERLHGSLARANPEHTLQVLSGRLEAIEQRFSSMLGRLAQRADLDPLRTIEAHMLDLAGELEKARERLDRIGAIDEQLRTLARKVDEAGEQRVGGLERLLRDCIAEWREGEQRTAGVLHNIEEAVGRLGETVDAMEAARPAPDLAVPTLTGSELERIAGVRGSGLASGADDDDDEAQPASPLYHATLDAADYAPKPFAAEGTSGKPYPPMAAAARQSASLADDLLAWSPKTGGRFGHQSGPKLTPGAIRIMALREKLRHSAAHGREPMPPFLTESLKGGPSEGAIGLTRLSLLVMAGAAFLAGSTYYLYQALVSATPTSPAMMKTGHPSAIQSDLGHTIERGNGKGAS